MVNSRKPLSIHSRDRDLEQYQLETKKVCYQKIKELGHQHAKSA